MSPWEFLAFYGSWVLVVAVLLLLVLVLFFIIYGAIEGERRRRREAKAKTTLIPLHGTYDSYKTQAFTKAKDLYGDEVIMPGALQKAFLEGADYGWTYHRSR